MTKIHYLIRKLLVIIVISLIIFEFCFFLSSDERVSEFYSFHQKELDHHRSSEMGLIDPKDNSVSLCSSKADKRGLHQNVIAYSLYGNFSDTKHFNRYFIPIKSNLDYIKKVYPGT